MSNAPADPLEPAIITIFGITGDLAQRYLLPALYHLIKDGLLHEKTLILGISRRDISVDQLLENVELCINEVDNICDPVALKKVREALRMHQMDMTSGDDYDALRQLLNSMEETVGECMNRLYYLSIPPQVFGPIVRNLGEHGLNASCQHGTAHTRLLVEKPFGYDLTSARELITDTAQWFGEYQLFRIDHYLAKETAQNIIAFRAFNPIFHDLWNNQHIRAITITASEKIGIEDRAIFYEQTGALRDFIQSHLLQLLAIVTMDVPDQLSSDTQHAARLAVLQATKAVAPDKVDQQAWRGQYQGYRDEVGKADSLVETYAAIRTEIDNGRWRGVPITLATGKALAERKTTVTVDFSPSKADKVATNRLSFRIQPDEGIDLLLNAKQPGFENKLSQVAMDFSYQNSFNENGHPNAYERVLVDAVRGDHTLFATSEEVLEAWRIVENVLHTWSDSGQGLQPYAKGTAIDQLPPEVDT
jgi:glucose-6-phosphate 1-dehydrogenase